MAKKTPTITDNVLQVYDPETERLITELDITDKQDWKYWQEFLSYSKSFRYVFTTKQGFKVSFTGVKEKRTNGLFWYAHKRVSGKLKRGYLGANRNLTAKKLKAVALKVCQGKLV